MYGGESVGKDVLEYVVFEKLITSNHGEWRLHHKIIPDWCPVPDSSPRTYIHDENEEEEQGGADSADKLDIILNVPA